MTRTQQQYYLAIRDFVSKHGYFPTMREIAQMMGIRSQATAYQRIQFLVREGYVIRLAQTRGYALVPEKMHNLSKCDRGHDVVWFMRATCPVCEVLARIPKV